MSEVHLTLVRNVLWLRSGDVSQWIVHESTTPLHFVREEKLRTTHRLMRVLWTRAYVRCTKGKRENKEDRGRERERKMTSMTCIHLASCMQGRRVV